MTRRKPFQTGGEVLGFHQHLRHFFFDAPIDLRAVRPLPHLFQPEGDLPWQVLDSLDRGEPVEGEDFFSRWKERIADRTSSSENAEFEHRA